MKRKPVVGILAKHYEDSYNKLWDAEYAHTNIIKLLKELEVIPIIIPLDPDKYKDDVDMDNGERIPCADLAYMNTVSYKIDGLILQGAPKSSELEIQFAYHCIAMGIPVLGISEGFDNIARSLELPLIDLDEDAPVHHYKEEHEYTHQIKFTPNSIFQKIFSCSSINVNSIHKIGMKVLDVYDSDMIDILATANDETVEAFGVKSFGVKRRDNVIAVKWHPELMMENKYSKLLFKYFIDKVYLRLYEIK